MKLLFLSSVALVHGSHDSWSCTDATVFPQTCVAPGPDPTAPHMAGLVVLGGARNVSYDTFPTLIAGEPTLACMLTRGSYSFIPAPIIAVGSNFKYCRDVDSPGFIWPSSTAPSTILSRAATETLGQACERLGQLSVTYATAPTLLGQDNFCMPGQCPGMPPFSFTQLTTQAVTSTCPRLGGPMGRGGTAAGYAAAAAKSQCSPWCNHYTCGAPQCAGCNFGGHRNGGCAGATNGATTLVHRCDAWCNSWLAPVVAVSSFVQRHCGGCVY